MGGRSVPRMPCEACVVLTYCPSSGAIDVHGVPPARPHASATGALPGVHSSPEEAAAIAAEAGVQRLVLVHAPAGLLPLDAARATFPATTWGADGDRVVVSAAVVVVNAAAAMVGRGRRCAHNRGGGRDRGGVRGGNRGLGRY